MLQAVENDFRVSVCRAVPRISGLGRSGFTSLKNQDLANVRRFSFGCWLAD